MLLIMSIGKQTKKQDFRGGKRINAGRKPTFSEPTETITFRCPMSKVNELKIIVKSKFSEWSVK